MHALFLPEKLTRFERVYKRNFNRNEGKAQSLTPYMNAIANSLNNRPRKTLGYRTPLEVFAELLDLEQAKLAENSAAH